MAASGSSCSSCLSPLSPWESGRPRSSSTQAAPDTRFLAWTRERARRTTTAAPTSRSSSPTSTASPSSSSTSRTWTWSSRSGEAVVSSSALLVIATYIVGWLAYGNRCQQLRRYNHARFPDRTAPPWCLDRLREAEHAIGIVLGLDLGQPGEVGTVVSLPPVGQRRVDVVLVGLAAGKGAHRLPEGLLPGVLAGHRGGRRADRPGGGVLGLEERVAVHERGGARGDPVDRAAERVERDPPGRARRTAGPLEALHASQQGADAVAAQRLGEEVGLGVLRGPGQLAGRVLGGQVALVHGQAGAARLDQHRVQPGCGLHERRGRMRACRGVQLLQLGGGGAE